MEIDDVPLTILYHQIVPITLDAIICRCYTLCTNSAYRVQSANFHPNQSEKYTCVCLYVFKIRLRSAWKVFGFWLKLWFGVFIVENQINKLVQNKKFDPPKIIIQKNFRLKIFFKSNKI